MRIRMLLRLQRRILISSIIIALTLFIIIHVFHIDPRKGEGPRHIHTYSHSRLSHLLGELEKMEHNNNTRNTTPDQKLVHPEIQPSERNSNNNNADVQQNVSSRSNMIIPEANMKPTDIVLDARKLSEHQTKHTGKTLTQVERNVTKSNITVAQAQATESDVQEQVAKGEAASPLKKVSSSSSSSSTTTPAAKDVSAECLPQEDPSDIKTSFKFYIYNLPAKFNSDIQHFMSTDKSHAHCYNLYHCGMGEELMEYSYNQGTQLSPNPFRKYLRFNRATTNINGEKINNNTYYKVSLRNTQQFALETIIHYKLLHSPYRTTDPNKADAFYIPAYTGLTCLGYYDNAAEKIQYLFKYLKTNQSKFFNSGKPHFSTISKIQREQGTEHCPTLREVSPTNITWIAIEKESNPFWSKYQHISHQSIIVAPYPSYVHFSNTRHDQYLLEQAHGSLADLSKTQFVLDYVPPITERDVFLFMAAGTRRSNLFRAKIIDQFAVQTDLSYEEYFSNKANKAGLLISAQKPASDNRTAGHCIMLKTVECEKRHRYTTIPWMMKSVFCLNPPGDSPTRKSFYDSILSGCIPVIFSEKYNTTYPFHHRLEYNTFTVTIQEYLISQENQKVVDILAKISPEKIAELHTNLLKVAKWFQYSVPDGKIQTDDDAMTLIMAELQQVFHFNLDHR